DLPVWLPSVSACAPAPIRKIAGPGVAVDVLPNGIDNSAWRVTPAPRDLDHVTLVSVMRLAPRKRPLHLLQLIRRVREQLPAGRTIEMVIIGEGPERASLETYMERHDLT